MKNGYEDIRSRIKEEPSWYDINGVPRYGKYHPEMCPSIYADECILIEIRCQHCMKSFRVEMYRDCDREDPNIRKLITDKRLHYGDPPAHNCTGDSMNCYDIKVIGFWSRTRSGMMPWKRAIRYNNRKLEGVY